VRRRWWTRFTVCALLGLVGGIAAVSVGSPAAHAGGGAWWVDRDHYLPGEHASAWAALQWELTPGTGTPDDGPYTAFLVNVADVEAGEQGGHGLRPEGSIAVGEVAIHPEPYVIAGVNIGLHHATLEFTVPDVPFGLYGVVQCSADCTKPLGDITGGVLTIGPASLLPPPPPLFPATTIPLTTTSPSTTTVAAIREDASRSSRPTSSTGPFATTGTLAAVGTAAAGAVGVVFVVWRQRLRRRSR
jgi:hypothetical protein